LSAHEANPCTLADVNDCISGGGRGCKVERNEDDEKSDGVGLGLVSISGCGGRAAVSICISGLGGIGGIGTSGRVDG